jgi:hypothetical protein
MNTDWLQAAFRNVDANLGNVITADDAAEQINEEIWTLAWDAALDAGADEHSASLIAEQVRQQLGIVQ